MNNQNLIIQFHKLLRSKNFNGEIVSAKHIPEIKNDINKHHQQKQIYPEFYEEYKSFFEFEPKVDFESVESLIVVAVPVPEFEVIFTFNNKKISLMIPPTYLYGRNVIDETQTLIESIFTPAGYNIAYAQLPVKTLAVRSGLAKYGRNNITYIPEMGSFYRLCAYYSDFPIEKDNWYELEMMEKCETCKACRQVCPTNAISDDRFLLHVERCITYHNEQPNDILFPKWLDPKWHNCLVGCMLCQNICPIDKDFKNWIEKGPTFTEEETRILLNSPEIDSLTNELKEKLEKSELLNYLELFPRNLQIFL